MGVAEAFGRAWLDVYGMDDVDANITDRADCLAYALSMITRICH